MLLGLSTFGDHGALQRARQALQAAVSELDRQGTSSDKVLVLGNLALVLQSLGVRGDFAAFDRSLEIYDDALRTLSRDKEPIPWAMAQNNLGILLMSLGIYVATRTSCAVLRHVLKQHGVNLIPSRQ